MKYSDLPTSVRFIIGCLAGIATAAILSILLTSCGSQAEDEYICAAKGESCQKSDKRTTGNEEKEPVVIQGPRGTSGSNGVDGQDGSNGDDGKDGVDGLDAEPGDFDIVEIVNPCGDASGFDEVLLRVRSGELLAHYSSGQKQFLTILQPGDYRTTDGYSCRFTVTPEYEITY